MEQRYFKIDKSKGRNTDVMLLCLLDEKEGKYVSKYYQTDLDKNHQSFIMLTDKSGNFLEKITRENTDAVEITAEEFEKESDRLRDLLC